MNIDDMTIKQARELTAMFANPTITISQEGSPYKLGQAYLFRTVTYSVTGVVARVTSQEIVVTDAAWIADTGRFGAALEKSSFEEIEAAPDGEVIIGRGAVTDAWPIAKAPRVTK
jgi:hypothetical protein